MRVGVTSRSLATISRESLQEYLKHFKAACLTEAHRPDDAIWAITKIQKWIRSQRRSR